MKKSHDIIARITELALLAFVVIFCARVYQKNFPENRRMVLSVPLHGDNRAVSALMPSDCIESQGDLTRVLCEKVDFTARFPHWFTHAQLVVTYASTEGAVTHASWRARGTADEAITSPLSDYETETGVHQVVFDLDLRERVNRDSLTTFGLFFDIPEGAFIDLANIDLKLQY